MLWTCSKAGRIEGDILIENGRIKAVGPNLQVPAGAEVIDATGKHVTPGLIDCHSHQAMQGGLNEGTEAVTCEVRAEDVLYPWDADIYRELAGGLTTSQLLHGSSNPIRKYENYVFDDFREAPGPPESKVRKPRGGLPA